jgi:hypothetical protein
LNSAVSNSGKFADVHVCLSVPPNTILLTTTHPPISDSSSSSAAQHRYCNLHYVHNKPVRIKLIHIQWFKYDEVYHDHIKDIGVGTESVRSSKGRIKFTVEQVVKAQRGSRGIALIFL